MAEKTIPSRPVPYVSPNPALYGLRVIVDPALINSAQSVALGTTYDASPVWMDKSFTAMGYGKYILSDVTMGDGSFIFWYLPNLTEEQKNTPFRSTPSTGNHYWPPILLDIEIEKSKFPRAVDTGDRIDRAFTYTATPIFIPNADTGTLFLLREFFSPTKFEIPQWPTPIATAVNFPVPGSRPFSFQECLHPDIEVPPMEDSSSSYDPTSLTISSNLGLTTPWFFPATDPKTWLSFILYDRQTLTDGGWHRTQMEVFPPNLPKRQRGLS